MYRQVVAFDAQVDSVPPHVAARLTKREIAELQEFLKDREQIRANPTQKNMLEALPGLLREATEVLESVDRVNKSTYARLTRSLDRLSAALEKVRPVRSGRPTRIRSMRESEAQKERLEDIRKRYGTQQN